MKQKKQNKQGYILLELVMMVALIFLFGMAIYQIISQGKSTKEKIIARKTAQIDARIALSFLNVKIKQNDIKDRIKIKVFEQNQKNALVIEERTLDTNYDRWIYYYDGKLYECITDVGEQPIEELSTQIAVINDFNISYTKNKRAIINKIDYSYKLSDKVVTDKLESIVNVRSN